MDRILGLMLATGVVLLILIDFGTIFGIMLGFIVASAILREDPVEVAKEWWRMMKGERNE